MKLFLYLSLLILFVACDQRPKSSSYSLDGEKDTVNKVMTPRQAAEPAQLTNSEDIQSAYTAVTSAISKGMIDSISFKYNCNNEKRGTVTCFSEKGKVRMVRHSYNEYDHYEATDQYFVKDSSLFFVFSKELSWSFDSNAPEIGGTKDNITEKRIYIINKQAVKCLEKKYVTFSYSKSNPQPGTLANKEVKCKSLKPVQEEYKALLRYVLIGGKGCPTD